MSINLTEINQKVLRTVQMGTDIFRKMYDMHYNPTPKNVPFDYPDLNGNLTTTQMPNMAKFRRQVWDDVGGALGQFFKNYYIDATNGDDNNTGGSSSPLKTIKKAVESAPAGAVVYVHLVGATHVIDATILSRFHRINILGDTSAPGGKSQVVLKGYHSNGYNLVAGIKMAATVYFRDIILDFDLSGQDGALPYSSESVAIWYDGQGGNTPGVQFYRTKINLPDNENIRVVYPNGATSGIMSLGLYVTEIHSASANSRLAKIVGTNMAVGTTAVTYSGAITSLEPLIQGIIKDANGVPRNFISNVVI